MLPIVHATSEELGIYLWGRIVSGLEEFLLQRGIHTLEIIVNEAVGQQAVFRQEIPPNGLQNGTLDVKSFLMEGNVMPMPCQSLD